MHFWRLVSRENVSKSCLLVLKKSLNLKICKFRSMELFLRYLEFQIVKNVKNRLSPYFKMQFLEFYSQRLEDNANDGRTQEVVSGNIWLIRLSFVFISCSVKIYKKISSNFLSSLIY